MRVLVRVLARVRGRVQVPVRERVLGQGLEPAPGWVPVRELEQRVSIWLASTPAQEKERLFPGQRSRGIRPG